MNLSEVITNIQLDLGIYKIALPIEGSAEDFLATVIRNKTIPVFSPHHPLYDTITFNTGLLETVEKGSNWTEYLLPDVFHNREILWVKRVKYKDNTVTGLSYFGGLPLSGGTLQSVMIANASANLASKVIPKITFDWKPPRRLRLYNVINSATVEVEFAFKQDKSLGSIEDSCYEEFMKLALLDCKMALYNILKHYKELNSMYGNIALAIDDWANAEQERAQLLEQWGNTSHMDQGLYEWI